MKKSFKFDKKYLDYLSSLSALTIKDSDKKVLAKELQETIKYINNINVVETKNIKPTNHTGNLRNVTFKDGKPNKRNLKKNEVFKNSKNKKDDYFITSKII